MTNSLIIISLDALNAKDLPYLKTLKNFSHFIKNGSYVESVDPVYPTLTYCCHTSIITGNYPNRHGIVHNEIPNAKDPLRQKWHWHKKDIQCPTLFDAAKRKRLKTASVLWPVMASANASIDYNVPEIWSDHGKSMASLFIKNGSLSTLPFVLKHKSLLNGKKQPELDNFIHAVSQDILMNKKPDLMAIHFTALDSLRHIHGIFSDEAYQAINTLDQRIGDFLQLLANENRLDTTNIILLGDHGGQDFTHAIFLNTLFKKHNLSKDAYASSAGGSVHIHLTHPEDKEIYQRVYQVLADFSQKENSPIQHLFTREELIPRHHIDGNYSFVLEGKDGYVFRNNTLHQIIIPREELPHCYKSDHGYLPENPNLKTLFFAMGPNIRPGVSLPYARLIDEGPTFAKLLKIAFPDVDGQALDSLLY